MQEILKRKSVKHSRVLHIKVSWFITAIISMLLFGNVFAALVSDIIGMGSTGTNMLLKATVFVLSVVVILTSLVIRGLFVTRTSIYFFLLVIIIVMNLLYSQTKLEFSSEVDPVYALSIGIGSIFFPFLAITLYPTKVGEIENVLFYLLVFFCLALISLGDTHAFDSTLLRYVDTGRLQLTSFNPISVSMLGGLLLLLAIFRLSELRTIKLRLILAGFLGLYVLFLGGSRSAILGVSFCFLAMLVIKNRKLTITIALITLLTTHSLFPSLFFDSIAYRLSYHSDPSINERFFIYRVYYDAVLANFAFPTVSLKYSLLHAHNIILAVYSAATIFGLIFFILILKYLFAAAFRLIKLDSDNGWVGLYFIFIFTISFFSGSLLDFYFWTIGALVIASARRDIGVTVGH